MKIFYFFFFTFHLYLSEWARVGKIGLRWAIFWSIICLLKKYTLNYLIVYIWHEMIQCFCFKWTFKKSLRLRWQVWSWSLNIAYGIDAFKNWYKGTKECKLKPDRKYFYSENSILEKGRVDNFTTEICLWPTELVWQDRGKQTSWPKYVYWSQTASISKYKSEICGIIVKLKNALAREWNESISWQQVTGDNVFFR